MKLMIRSFRIVNRFSVRTRKCQPTGLFRRQDHSGNCAAIQNLKIHVKLLSIQKAKMIIQGHHLKGEFYISLTYSVKIIHFSPNDSFIKRFYKIKKSRTKVLPKSGLAMLACLKVMLPLTNSFTYCHGCHVIRIRSFLSGCFNEEIISLQQSYTCIHLPISPLPLFCPHLT